MIDMEEGVVNEILKGPLRDVFDCQQLITDVSGSGNNWYIYVCTCQGGGRDEVWDRETMFSQLAKRSPCVMVSG